jgi:nucleotide-binding universal stress UspA family protein
MRILLPVDGSEHSNLACQALLSRPWAPGTQVRVLHVLPKFAFSPLSESADPSQAISAATPHAASSMMEACTQMTRQAEALTRRIAEQLRGAGLQVDTRIEEGDARTEILSEAEDWEADLIVLASHGHTGLKQWLLGSVAHSIVSHAPCSVEIVREKAAQPPSA